MRYAVGIDQATHCGWAVLDETGTRVASGVWDLSIRKGEGAGMRFVRFTGHLLTLCRSLFLDADNCLVFYEESFAGANNASEIAGGLIGVIQLQCETKRIPYAAIHYGTVKKWATGTGRASKLRMVQAANSHWHLNLPYVEPPLGAMTGGKKPKLKEPTFPGGSDNEADALWIAWAGLCTNTEFTPGIGKR